MKILVTGGAGYIGSFMVRRLLADGHDVTVADNLKRGHKEAVDSQAALQIGDLTDKKFTDELFENNKFDAVIHFAGYISMSESMQEPQLYFTNNTLASLNILDSASKNNVDKIIFSSTAGVYGMPIKLPIDEDHPKNPENPYGESKLMTERMLSWYHKIFGTNFVVLRYFNASGASLDSKYGESHDPESHIIPCAINAALSKNSFKLYGADYDTHDGTCIRDYIHVLDLVEAHVLALNKLTSEKGGFYYNVGTGKGYSNSEVLSMIKKVSGIDFQIDIVDKRPGDADSLVADTTRIQKELGFAPIHSDLETIVTTAWKWHSREGE